MDEKRIIKKYPNRRLYDTAISKYITLDDIRHLVLDEADFAVIDAKTKADITRNILLQVILEQEEGGEPIFTTDILSRIIRFYGNAVQGLASDYLERSLALFTEQQHRFNEQISQAVTTDPLTALTELTQRNLSIWRDMQKGFFKAAGMNPPGEEDSGDK